MFVDIGPWGFSRRWINTNHWRGAVTGVVLGMILVGCGAGRTMVMEPAATFR